MTDVTRNEQPYDLDGSPGPLVRRTHQIGIAVFLAECGEFGVTPLQFSVLYTLSRQTAGIEQIRLARQVALDRTTVAIILRNLEKGGLVSRVANPTNRRAKLVTITEQGRKVLETMLPRVLKVQQRMIEPLTVEERAQFLTLLRKLAQAHNEVSRAPMAYLPIR